MAMLAEVSARITQAMKAHDAATLSAYRMLKAALINKEVEKGRALEDAEAFQVIAADQAAARFDRSVSAAAGRSGGQGAPPNRAAEWLMPPHLTRRRSIRAIDAAHRTAPSMKDVGRVMKAVMAALSGKPADGKTEHPKEAWRLEHFRVALPLG